MARNIGRDIEERLTAAEEAGVTFLKTAMAKGCVMLEETFDYHHNQVVMRLAATFPEELPLRRSAILMFDIHILIVLNSVYSGCAALIWVCILPPWLGLAVILHVVQCFLGA